jgi:DNA-binding Lrp family transcriptional regulator
MDYTYNKKRHFELLKLRKSSDKSEAFVKPRTFLSQEEFLKSLNSKPDENFYELLGYSAMISCHLHWENREDYFELIEKLLNGPLHFLELREKHRAIGDAVEYLEADLILLEPNEKSEGFDDLIDEVISLFDRYCPEPSLRESHEFSEEELKQIIQDIFIQMKDRYPLD